MDSFRNPISGGPNDPYDRYRVEPVEERQSKGQMPHLPDDDKPPKEKLKFPAYVLQILRKAVNFFIEKHRHSAIKVDGLKQLLILRTSLEILKKEDRSQDVEFLNELSRTWAILVEESLHFESKEVSSKFRLLVKSILGYPKNERHTFGYYLTEFAGQKWVPFPYMELVQKIHREHEKNPDTSALAEWTHLLDDVISHLQ